MSSPNAWVRGLDVIVDSLLLLTVLERGCCTVRNQDDSTKRKDSVSMLVVNMSESCPGGKGIKCVLTQRCCMREHGQKSVNVAKTLLV